MNGARDRAKMPFFGAAAWFFASALACGIATRANAEPPRVRPPAGALDSITLAKETQMKMQPHDDCNSIATPRRPTPRVLRWETPRAETLSLDAEIGLYQEDDAPGRGDEPPFVGAAAR